MCVKRSGAEAIDPETRRNHSSQAFGREDGQLVDVSNVPTLSGSFHGWDKLFSPLVPSFRIDLIEEDVGSSKVPGSLQSSHLVLEP